jgi:regulatory protein
VLDELRQQGWQSDERFAQAYTKYRLTRGFGALKIQYELKQRGIKDFDLNSLVAEEFGGWQDLLQQVYRQKYPDDIDLTVKEWQKRSYFLQQRGFSGTMINKLFQQLNLKNNFLRLTVDPKF